MVNLGLKTQKMTKDKPLFKKLSWSNDTEKLALLKEYQSQHRNTGKGRKDASKLPVNPVRCKLCGKIMAYDSFRDGHVTRCQELEKERKTGIWLKFDLQLF